MIKNVNVYNFKFGDCFLVIGNTNKTNYQLMVDCGSTTPKSTTVKNAFDFLKTHLNNNKNEGLITHFHNDHINLIGDLDSDTFENFYCPNFFSRNEIKLQLYTIILTSKSSKVYQFAYQLLNLIPFLLTKKIVKSKGTIRFLKKDDKIIDNIEILWPDPNIKNIEETLKKVMKRYSIALDDYNSNHKTDINSENKSIFTEISRTIEDVLDRFIEMLDSNSDNIEVNEINYESSEKIKDSIEQLNKYRIYLASTELSKEEINAIKKIQNEYSLVFQKVEKDEKNILFLGDVTSSNFNTNISKGIKNNYYNIIKVAHHGTKDYYSKNLPDCEKMIITNYSEKSCNLFSKYALKYPKSECICTNNKGCEIFEATGKSCSIIKKALDTTTLDFGKYCNFTNSFETI